MQLLFRFVRKSSIMFITRSKNVTVRCLHLPLVQDDLLGTAKYKETRTILMRYDAGDYEGGHQDGTVVSTLQVALIEKLVLVLKQELTACGDSQGLFGKRHNDALFGIVANIQQSFGGVMLYPSVKCQAAHLFYSLIKSHPFLDGNKRIASAIFVHFLESNAYVVDRDGICKISAEQLADMVIMVAESSDSHKDFVIRQIEGVLERR